MTSTMNHTIRQRTGQDRGINGLFTFETSFGWVAAEWTEDQLTRLAFGYENPKSAVAALQSEGNETQEIMKPRGEALQFAERVQAYFDGHVDSFLDVRISLDANTDFQRKVLEHCRRIPHGQTRSYAELARAAGSPNACRAVGNIMAKNRIPLIIPCHRVVGSRGSLGGYSAPSGLSLKRRLLRLEGAEIVGSGRL